MKSKIAKKQILKDDSDSEGNKGNVDESDSNSEPTEKSNRPKKKVALFDDCDSDDSDDEEQLISGVIQGNHGGKRGKFINAQKVPRNQQQQHQRCNQMTNHHPESLFNVSTTVFLLIFRATSINH